jgi:hypothetical protein
MESKKLSKDESRGVRINSSHKWIIHMAIDWMLHERAFLMKFGTVDEHNG